MTKQSICSLSRTEPLSQTLTHTSIHIGDADILFSLQAKNLGMTLTNNLLSLIHI